MTGAFHNLFPVFTSVTLLLLNLTGVCKQVQEYSIIREEFENNKLQWPIGNRDYAQFTIVNNRYIISHTRSGSNGWLVTKTLPITFPSSYTIKASMKVLEGVDAGFGMAFGGDSPNNIHIFVISDKGYYRYSYYSQGEYIEIIPWTKTNAVNLKAFNELKIDVEDTDLSFYVNNQLVNQVSNVHFFGEKTGFIVYQRQKIEIDYLEITQKKNVTITERRSTPLVVTTTADTESLGTPTYHALLIGISDYLNNSPDLHDLHNPVNDAQILKEVLISNYTFSAENIRVLKNPNRAEFINELEHLSEKVGPTDNLLIFYAGHGIFDKKLEVGYWLAADATTTSKANWISNSTIRDYLAGIDTKHTLLISDACFSGSIFKTREVKNTLDNFGFARMYKLNSRKAITSGTLNTVPDKSVFLHYLIKRLKENESQYLPSGWLFHDIEAAVINNTNNIPQYGTIQNSGDEGGDFIFIRK